MNADLYQPHVSPNTAPKRHPTTTSNGNGAAHHPEQETLHSNPVLKLDNVLMELEHGGKDLLKIAHRAPKCGQDLRTESRSLHATTKQEQLLKKAACSSKQSLLSEVRTAKATRVLCHHHPAHIKFSQALFQDIRAWHIKVLLKKTATANKQALLSEIRWAGRPGPRQAILRDVVRFAESSSSSDKMQLHTVQTACRTTVWQDVRAMHGHAYKHLPPKEKGAWMMDIHSYSSNKAHHRFAQTKTMNKQSMLSQLRCSDTATTLRHVSTKSTQMLLSQLRRTNSSTMMKLYYCPTVDRHALMAEIRAMHGHAYKHLPRKQEGWMMGIHNVARHKLRRPTRTIHRQGLFSQIRAARCHHHDWKHHGVLSKSIPMLLSQVRSAHGHPYQHSVATRDRRALMSFIRMMHGVASKHLPLKQESNEWMMEIHALPRRQLYHHARTVNKQSLLSEIRSSHVEMQSVTPKSIQMLLSQVRMIHGHVLKPKSFHGTMNRSALLSDVRACHGHAPIHLPKNTDSRMMEIHSPHLLHHVKAMNKQALFTEIRTTDHSGTVLHHVMPKSVQMVLSQARMMHNGHKLNHHATMNRSALMSDIRACYGTAPKHLPKDCWMMDIQRPHHDLHHAKTINKQGLLSQIRTTHPRMHHAVFPPKSNHDLMMQLRSMHGAKHGPMHLRPCDPMDRQGLMTDIRATHGHAIAEVCG